MMKWILMYFVFAVVLFAVVSYCVLVLYRRVRPGAQTEDLIGLNQDQTNNFAELIVCAASPYELFLLRIAIVMLLPLFAVVSLIVVLTDAVKTGGGNGEA